MSSTTGTWIPCKDRQPKKWGEYIITIKVYCDNKWDGKTVETDGCHWQDGWVCRYDSDVIAWMEMPEPYREEQEEWKL